MMLFGVYASPPGSFSENLGNKPAIASLESGYSR